MALPTEGKVECVTGDLGGGKSAHAVWLAYQHLERGGVVFTNIEVWPDAVGKRLAESGLKFDPSRLRQLPTDCLINFQSQLERGKHGLPVMVLLDEAQFDFDAGQKAEWEKRLLVFLALARKLRLYVCFICHNMAELKIGIRRKITVETVCRNLKEERIAGIPFPIPFYFVVSFKVLMGVSRHRLDSEWFLRLPAWGLYNSYALLGKEAEEYAALPEAQTGRLERIPVDRSRYVFPLVAACSAVSTILFL
jgi:hypothetical protein